MICEECNKKLLYLKDVVDDPFMYCTNCLRVWVEMKKEKGLWYEVKNAL